MSKIRVKNLFQEKSSLLREWSRNRNADKVKILIRLIEIDDELVELEGMKV